MTGRGPGEADGGGGVDAGGGVAVATGGTPRASARGGSTFAPGIAVFPGALGPSTYSGPPSGRTCTGAPGPSRVSSNAPRSGSPVASVTVGGPIPSVERASPVVPSVSTSAGPGVPFGPGAVSVPFAPVSPTVSGPVGALLPGGGVGVPSPATGGSTVTGVPRLSSVRRTSSASISAAGPLPVGTTRISGCCDRLPYRPSRTPISAGPGGCSPRMAARSRSACSRSSGGPWWTCCHSASSAAVTGSGPGVYEGGSTGTYAGGSCGVWGGGLSARSGRGEGLPVYSSRPVVSGEPGGRGAPGVGPSPSEDSVRGRPPDRSEPSPPPDRAGPSVSAPPETVGG